MERISGLSSRAYEESISQTGSSMVEQSKSTLDPWYGKRSLYEKYVKYQWERPQTEREIIRFKILDYLHDWLDRESYSWPDEDRARGIFSLKTLWRESCDSYEERIKVFQPEVQGIIDGKITSHERYDRRSYETYLKLAGLYAPNATKSTLTAEDVKSKISMQDLAGRYVELRKSGSNFICRCPFHDDKHPSATVYTKTNTFKCFSCGEFHDVIGFLMKIENLTFLQALNSLAI
jgi:hypothetical protein